MNLNYFSKVKILDGGMGQQILARGLKPKGSLWSGTALIDKKYHQIVIDSHLDFISSLTLFCAILILRPAKLLVTITSAPDLIKSKCESITI